MKTKHVFVAALVLLLCAGEFVTGQTRKSGINSAAFLKVGVGARNVGLGSAATSLSEDVANIFWNPAGVALKSQRLQATFNYNNWIAGLNQNAVGVSYDLGGIGTVGVGVMTFGVSDIPADRDVYPGNPTLQALQIDQATSSTYDYMDLVAQITYARYVSDKLSLGASFKFINEKIDDQNARAIAFDLGSVYHVGILGWSIGARLNNLGGDLKFYDYASPIPLTFAIGMSMVPLTLDKHSFLLAIDGVKPQDGQQYYFSGLEYNYDDMIFLRTGWKYNYSFFGLAGNGVDEGTSQRGPLRTSLEKGSLGAGVRVVEGEYTIKVDYAYTIFESLDNVHRFSLQISLK